MNASILGHRQLIARYIMEILINNLNNAMELRGSRSVAYMKVSTVAVAAAAAAAALKTLRMLAGWYLNVVTVGRPGWPVVQSIVLVEE